MSDCCKVQAIVINKPQPITHVTQILRGPAGAPGSGANNSTIESFTPTAGQTNFPLANTVVSPQLSQVYVNGKKLIYLQGYNFTGSMNILTFILAEYALDASDDLEIYYSF